METNCIRCNALQKFGIKKRETLEGIFEEYIECNKCHKIIVVNEGSSDKLSLDKEIAKLKIRAELDPNLKKVLVRKQKERAKLERT